MRDKMKARIDLIILVQVLNGLNFCLVVTCDPTNLTGSTGHGFAPLHHHCIHIIKIDNILLILTS